MATTNLGLQTINQSDNISPDPINANMELIDKLGVDYVTQQGKSGQWRYRRWKSGTFECWASPHYQTPGGGATRSFNLQYPVTFAEPPVVNVNVRNDGNNQCYVTYVENTTTYAEWYASGLTTTNDVDCFLHVIGRV